MKTHFIYNKKTGDIVHVHVSDEGQNTSKEGLLHKLSPSFKKNDFDVHSAEGSVEPTAYKFDVLKKSLVKQKASSDSAFGSAGLMKPGSIDYRNVRTTYKKA
jgi:hypothetical protein